MDFLLILTLGRSWPTCGTLIEIVKQVILNLFTVLVSPMFLLFIGLLLRLHRHRIKVQINRVLVLKSHDGESSAGCVSMRV
jgi:hypothetical protein